MAIFGAPYWNDRKRAYFVQGNNSIEHILRCRLPAGTSALETCGPTASVSCQASLGHPVWIGSPGGYLPQPEDLLATYFNDPRNFAALRKAWGGLDPASLPGNEVAQWYPLAVRDVFGNTCAFSGSLSYSEAVDCLRKGHALQVCLKRPGHFIALVAYDEERAEFIFNDGWAERWPEGDGFNRRLSRADYEANLKPQSLVYW